MALEIFRLVGSVFVDTDAANKSLKNTDKEAAQLGQSLVKGIQNVGKFVAGVGAAATAVGAGVIALTESTREYRTEQGKLQTAFETQNFSAEAARKTYEELNGILGDSGQAVEASNHLAMLANNEKDLSTWTKIATGVYATFGDSLPIENLTEAANETAKTGALTGGLADALNWAGVNEDKFQESLDKCRNEQERQALITDTLNGLYTEAADKYRENNAEVIAANKAQDKLNQVMADAGAALEPVVTKGKELAAEVLQKATPYIKQLGEVAVPLLSQAFDVLVDAVTWTVDLFMAVGQFAQEHPTLMTVLAVAVGTLAAAIIAFNIAQNAATIATGIATAATAAWGAVVAFATSPVTLIVVAIGALIAIIVLLVKHWDTVKAATLRAWSAFQNFLDKLGPFGQIIKNRIANVVLTFKDMWAGIKQSWEGIKQIFSGIVTFISGVFTGNWSKAWKGVQDIFGGYWKALMGIAKAPLNSVIRMVNTAIGGLNKISVKIPKWVPEYGGKTFGINIPKIPELEDGTVLKKGQVGLLEGNGAEAVVPLDKNQKWIRAVARDMEGALGVSGNDKILAVLLDILDALEELSGVGLYLDKKKLVGYLAKDMDKALGQLQVTKGRT